MIRLSLIILLTTSGSLSVLVDEDVADGQQESLHLSGRVIESLCSSCWSRAFFYIGTVLCRLKIMLVRQNHQLWMGRPFL